MTGVDRILTILPLPLQNRDLDSSQFSFTENGETRMYQLTTGEAQAAPYFRLPTFARIHRAAYPPGRLPSPH